MSVKIISFFLLLSSYGVAAEKTSFSYLPQFESIIYHQIDQNKEAEDRKNAIFLVLGNGSVCVCEKFAVENDRILMTGSLVIVSDNKQNLKMRISSQEVKAFATFDKKMKLRLSNHRWNIEKVKED